MSFQFEPVPSKGLRFDIRGIREIIRAAMVEEAKIHKRLLDSTTRRWSGDRPKMETKTIISFKRVYVNTQPKGAYPPSGRDASSIWWYLEEGTKIRWALMSDDWISKTRRGVLSSRSGRGRVLIAGKRAMSKRGIAARPGIEARNWRAKIVKMRFRKMKGQLQREFALIGKNTITPQGLRR